MNEFFFGGLILSILSILIFLLIIIKMDLFCSEDDIPGVILAFGVVCILMGLSVCLFIDYGYQKGQADYSIGKISFQEYKGNVVDIRKDKEDK